MREVFLTEMKAPAEVHFPGDFYKVLTKIDAENAFGKMIDTCVIQKTAQ